MSCNLRDIYPNHKRYDGDLGLELEVESNNPLPHIDSMVWRTERDPSLRGAYAQEYVTKKPLPIAKTETCVRGLLAQLKESKPNEGSSTTSWHVHVNALKYNPVKFVTCLHTYWLLEPLLINYCGPQRKQNTFCLTLEDAGALVNSLDERFYTSMVTSPKDACRNGCFSDEYRYGAQNLAAFRKFGSVEYRAMEGTLNSEKIMVWLNTLNSIWTNNKYDNPDHLFDTYYDHGIERIIRDIFNDTLDKPIVNPYMNKEVSKSIEANALVLIASLEENPYPWDTWMKRIIRNKDKRGYAPPPPINPIEEMWVEPQIAQAANGRVNIQFNGNNWVVNGQADGQIR